MLPILTGFWIRVQHPIDALFLKLSKNKFSLSGILGGINVIQLTAVGAKTGRSYTIPLIGVFNEKEIVLIASNFGRKHNPSWYYNLKAHPACEVLFNGNPGKYIAYETVGDEYEKCWQIAVSYYRGYENYKKHAAHRHIPVMVLEPIS